MVTKSELMEFLESHPAAEKFTPYCHVSEQADTLTVYFRKDADYSKRLSDHITLYLSLANHELVGCRIKGIAGILADLPNYIHVKHNKVALSVVFLAFRGGAENEVTSTLNDLARVASRHKLTLEPV